MNTRMQPATDIVDEYVDALLCGALEAAPVAPAAASDTGSATVHPDASIAVPAEGDVGVIETVSHETAPAEVDPVATTAVEAASPVVAPVEPAPMPPPRIAPVPAPPRAAMVEAPPASPRAHAPAAAAHRWLRVAIGPDSYALELLCVQEVVRVTPIVAMRGASRAVLGVMNLRGRIVPVFDLGLWLGTTCVQADERSRIVVVERNDELIGVLVTQVEDVVTLAQDAIEPPLRGSAPGPILGVARVGATPTVLLDAGALFGV